MSDIASLKKNIQTEEARFRSATSESVAQKLGGSINFINKYQNETKRFEINGKYGLLTLPFAAVDGIDVTLTNTAIYGVSMYVRQAGSGGTTELDLKYATVSGGSWTSMFSTTPKIQSAAGDYVWIYQNLITSTSSALSSTTAPVISVTSLTANYSIRADIIQAQTGDARGCGITIYYAPR